MADPNYGYKGRFDAAWRLIEETRSANLFWMEEISPETPADYGKLRSRMDGAGIGTKLAAGEHMRDIHQFDPYLQPKLLMSALQLDIRQGGFLDNAELARSAGKVGAIVVPHNWASEIGVVMGTHLARAAEAIPMAESDRSTCHVLTARDFRFENGAMIMPAAPGLGIGIDEDVYARKCKGGEVVIS